MLPKKGHSLGCGFSVFQAASTALHLHTLVCLAHILHNWAIIYTPSIDDLNKAQLNDVRGHGELAPLLICAYGKYMLWTGNCFAPHWYEMATARYEVMAQLGGCTN